MQKAHYVLVLTLTLGFLTSCDELEWEFLGRSKSS